MEELLKILVDNPDRTNALAAVANVLVAALALMVAGTSIICSIKSFSVQKKHNKLSVKPIPFIAVADYENAIWVKLVNNGSGPLIVNSTRVDGLDQSTESLIKQMPKLPLGLAWTSFTSGMKNRSVLPGNELFFIHLVGDPNDCVFATFRNECRLVISELTITIEYTDIYSDPFEPCSRELKWFARKK
jgi:hypothetical protein